MKINMSTDQRLDELEDAVGGVMEETTGLRGELNDLRTEVNDFKDHMEQRFEEQGKKLDKILDVVLTKEEKTERRLTRLEQINGIVGTVQ